MGVEIFPAKSGQGDLSLREATVILPAVSFANVGELALDVLITSLLPAGLSLVARVDEPNCLPVVGNDAYSLDQPGSLTTAMELFQLQGTSTYFLQQRAPAMKGRQAAFAASLGEWLQQQGVKQVIVLCGLDAQTRRDKQIMGVPTRFLSPDAALQELCVKELGLAALEEDYLTEEKQLHGLLPPWPMLEVCQRCAVPALLLTRFAIEGDNQADGMALAQQTLSLLVFLASSGVRQRLEQVEKSTLQLKAPCSWVALYGRSMGLGVLG